MAWFIHSENQARLIDFDRNRKDSEQEEEEYILLQPKPL